MGEKLVLIDGHSILNRAFFGIPDLTNSEGLHTNAVYGFLNIMFKILEEEQRIILRLHLMCQNRLSATKCSQNTKARENRWHRNCGNRFRS